MDPARVGAEMLGAWIGGGLLVTLLVVLISRVPARWRARRQLKAAPEDIAGDTDLPWRRFLKLEAECPRCGVVTLAAEDLRCVADSVARRQGICEFVCPLCSLPVFTAVSPDGIEALHLVGAGMLEGRVPFELLERRDGPAISWDDFLDLRMALATAAFPQDELVEASGR